MSQRPRSAKPAVKAPRSNEVPIERDTTFVRIGADDVIPVGRKRDYQLSFLARGTEPAAFGPRQKSSAPGSTGAQAILMRGSVQELARVTLPHSQAFTLAMRIIDDELSAGRRSVDFVRTAIEGLLQQYLADNEATEATHENDDAEDEQA